MEPETNSLSLYHAIQDCIEKVLKIDIHILRVMADLSEQIFQMLLKSIATGVLPVKEQLS